MEAVTNRQARYDYELLEKYEAGLVLRGHEVKSVKAGQINLTGSYITVKHGERPELFLINANISKYKAAGTLPDYSPTRSRKLLLNRREILSILNKIKAQSLTIVPTRVYTRNNRVKVEFALARGKKLFDKRQSIKEREGKREVSRALKTTTRG